MARADSTKPTDWWANLFMTGAVVVLAASLWYGITKGEFEVLLLGLTLGAVLVAVAFRPWRNAQDKGAFALWSVGAALAAVGLWTTGFGSAAVVAGLGAGFVLGLAAARHVYPKPTP